MLCFMALSTQIPISSCFKPLFFHGNYYSIRRRCSTVRVPQIGTETRRIITTYLRPSSSLGDDELYRDHDAAHNNVFRDDCHNDDVKVDLWLDLRDTSIPPLTALLHLIDDLWDEYNPPKHKSFIVDKVIVDNRHTQITKFLLDMKEEFEDEIGLVVVQQKDKITAVNKHNGGDFINVDCGSIGALLDVEKKILIGRIFDNVQHDVGMVNVNSDPMPVLETVLDGKWAILDTNKNFDSNSIHNLVEFVSFAISSPGALLLENPRVEDDAYQSEITTIGGIGVRCNTQGQVVELGSLFRSMRGKNYRTTQSGVLIQSPSTGEELSPCTSGNGLHNITATDATINYALLMPFDALLWKTASFIFG